MTAEKTESFADRKQRLLASLEGKSSYRYKRYSGLPLRYAGGKSLAVGYVVEHLPDSVERLMSPFFGGGSVEFACANELGLPVQGYDIFDVLVCYWQQQLAKPQQLADQLLLWSPDKSTYAEVKERLRQHWKKEQRISSRLELAAHYWFNHNLSYGPGFLGWMSSIYQEQDRFERLVGKVARFASPNTKVKRGTFDKTIPAHPDDFLYCDPPYYLGDDSRMFKGIYPQRNFPIHHKGFDHELLRDLLAGHPSGFILSYNDCPTVREWYQDYQIVEVRWQYTLGQGETRIGKNRIASGTDHVKQSHELLIVGV